MPLAFRSDFGKNRGSPRLEANYVSRDWEATFSSWGAPPGSTEKAKCENAERIVRKAIDASDELPSKSIEVFAQGSYANRTNVRQDSDVDICVLYTGAFFPDYSFSEGLCDAVLGFTGGGYPYSKFKNCVEAALKSYLGAGTVTRGNKAFDVHANTYRVDADVVPCFEHRRYCGTPATHDYLSGTEFRPDNGGAVINWPRQSYRNGVAKNEATNRRFKPVTRVLKRLRNEMADNGDETAEPVPSYLIECLVWNVSNAGFGHDTYKADVRFTLAHLWNQTRSDDMCNQWREISDLKYLFHPIQQWTRGQVHAFLQSAWDYIGFK